ncbi:MAG: T9SS type A sorting domain-containing protein [Chitinophagales bacterium]
MKNFYSSFLLLIACILSFESGIAQTVNLEVYPDQAQMRSSGVGSQCCSSCDCASTYGDPRVRVQYKHSGTGTWSGTADYDRDDIGCTYYNRTGGISVYTAGGISGSNTVNIQLNGWEADGTVCGGNDGDCGGYGVSSGTNNVTINSISPCSNSSVFTTTRSGCSSDGTTNDYDARWYYRWCWNGTTGLSAGAISGTATICTGGDLGAFTNTTSPTAQYSNIQWEQSPNNSTWSNVTGGTGANTLTYDPPALTATTYYRRRIDYCINFSGGVGSITSNVITITVVGDPAAPTATQSPGTDVCLGASISLTSPTTPSGGTGTATYFYATSSNSGGSYSSFSSTSPSQTVTAAGTGLYREQIYVTYSGVGCDQSPTTTYQWNSVADPTTTDPGSLTICAGGAPVLTSTPSGGTGTLNSQWQYSTTGTGGWANVAAGTPTSWSYTNPATAAVTVNTNATATPGLYYYRNNVTNSLGCDVISNTSTLTVVADPGLPTATKNPNTGVVCDGAPLTLTGSTFGTGGTGTGSFEYRYTTDAGATYTGWGATLPNFPAVVGTSFNSIQIRSVYTGLGCDASGANTYTWTGLADPTLTSPGTATICAGGSNAFSSTAAGGTGTYSHKWQYSADGSTNWTDVVNGTPSNYSYSTAVSGGTSTLTVSTTNAVATGTVYFRDSLSTVTTPTNTGCNAISSNATLTIVADPTLSDPGSPGICKGGSTTLTTNATGGTGTFTYTWKYFNGTSWVTLSNGTPTGVTYTASTNSLTIATNNGTTPTGSYQYRCDLTTSTPTGGGCDAVSPTSTVTVNADPTLSAPTSVSICKGGTANLTSNVTAGGTGTYNLQWNYFNGTSWVAVSDGTPTGVTYSGNNSNTLTVNADNATSSAGTYSYQLVLTTNTPSGAGCDATSATGTVTIANDPAAPTATKAPSAATVCQGAALTLSAITAGGGGAGSCNFETRYSTDNGSTWSSWVAGASPTAFTAVTGTNLMEVRQNCGGNGCDISNATQYSWTVVDDPGAPSGTKSPNAGTVCAGATLTVSSPTPGSNGTGTCNVEYRYSTNNGVTYTGWSTSVPSFAAVAGGNNYIEMRTNCNGSGCDISSTTQLFWNVVSDPTVSISPSSTAQCGSINQTLSANVTGGTGTPTYGWEWDQGSSSWTGTGTNSSGLNISLSTPGTYLYRVNYSTDGAGCDATTSSNATMTVRQNPSISVISDDCSYNSGSNQEYIVNTITGGTPPYSYTSVPGTVVQRYSSANSDVRVYRVPASATSYSFNIQDNFGCTSSGSVTPTSTVPSNIPVPGSSGTYTADCASRSLNEWEHYKQIGDNNNVLLSVNDQGVDLGTVNVTCYVNDTTPFLDKTCQGVTFKTYGMRRHWKITSSNYTNGATFPTNVKLRLYFTQAEANDLSTKSLAGTANGCADDDDFADPTGLTDLFVTKYTGSNEDDKYWNNSSSGVFKVYGPITTNSAYAGPLTVGPAGFGGLMGSGNTHHYVELSVDRFSEIWLNGAEHGQALPVKMLFFEANAMDNRVIRLSWATATEIENYGFEVERSTNGVDFTKIGFIAGHGNTSTRMDYMTDDRNAVPNVTYYYRLKQVDVDGHFEYSSVVTARLNGERVFTVSEFIPNPATGRSRLDIFADQDETISIRIFNLVGQEVVRQQEAMVKGYNSISVEFASLPVGTYTAEITTQSGKIIRRVSVNH